MKTRQCFVSNSSSSSFLIIGKDVAPADLKVGDNARYLGDSFDGEGMELVIELLDDKMVKLARKYSKEFDFIRPDFVGSGSVHIIDVSIAAPIKVFSGDFSDHCIGNAFEMKEQLQLGKRINNGQ